MDTERNIRNKISRGKFTAVFLIAMPRGYRLLIVALAGLALTGTAPPKEQNPNHNAADNIAPSTQPVANYSPYPDREAESCYESQDHDAADLCAQWRAATAAEEAADASYQSNIIGSAGAVLSFISVLLIVWTLCLTRQANKISRNAAHADLRPYVYVSQKELTFDEMLPGMISSFGFITLTMKNYGRTPAKNVVFEASAEIGGYWSEPPPLPQREAVKIHHGDIPPDATVEQDGYSVSDLAAEQPSLRNGTKSVFVWGKITYTDAAGGAYETNFRFASSSEYLDDKKFITCPEGNDAT